MTTNRHRSEDVLAYTLIQYRHSRPGDVAAALADALHTNGLLTPDGLRYEYDDHDTQQPRRRLVGPWHQTNPNRKERTMTTTARAEAILTARHHKDQMEGDGAVGCFDAAAAVAELHAAGLLAPDLPPVHVDDRDERPHVTITGTHAEDKARLRVDEDGRFHAINAWTDPMNPAEARERAYALLALANYSEGSNR